MRSTLPTHASGPTLAGRPGRALLLAVLLAACSGGFQAGRDTAAGSTTGTTPPPPETACDDGLDNDLDGLADCEDADCAAEFHCTWPDAMEHQGQLAIRWENGAEWLYDDCRVVFSGTLQRVDEPDACPDCDRTFTGPLTYAKDTCSTQLGQAPPAEATYGVLFVDESTRRIFIPDAKGWVELGEAVDDGKGTYRLARLDDVIEQGTDYGDLTTNLAFTDAFLDP